MRVNQGRPGARAAMVHRAFQRGVTFERVRAVAFLDMQVRKIRDELRDAAAGGLRFDGNGNRVAIVFDEKENGHAAQRGGIDGFVELALAGGSFSSGDVGHFVALEADRITQRSAARLFESLRKFFVVERSFRGANGVQPSRARGRRSGDDVPFLASPVRRHLAAARRGVVLRADGLEQHLVWRDAEHESERAVAVVREEPIVARLQQQARRDEDAFMAGAAHLKENLVLPLELDFAIVQAAREEHRAVEANQRFAVEALVFCRVECCGGSDFGLGRHAVCLRSRGWAAGMITSHYSKVKGSGPPERGAASE